MDPIPYLTKCLAPYVKTRSLPSSWGSGPGDKSELLHLSRDSLLCEYSGTGTDYESAQAKSNAPYTCECGIGYYEVTIVDSGKVPTQQGQKGIIGVGFGKASIKLNRLPGWEFGSYGYHGDDGKKFTGAPQGEAYGPTYGVNDTVGCIVNFLTSTISFTKNGLFLGECGHFKEDELHAIIGMRTKGEKVTGNFGQEDFKFNLRDYAAAEFANYYNQLSGIVVADEEMKMRICVMNYLLKKGFHKTARLLSQKFPNNVVSPAQLQSCEFRRAVFDLLKNNDFEKAWAMLKENDPQIFQRRKDLEFLLYVVRYLCLYKCGDLMSVVELGKEIVAKFMPLASHMDIDGPKEKQKQCTGGLEISSPCRKKMLQLLFALVAYDRDAPEVSALVDEKLTVQIEKQIKRTLLCSTGEDDAFCLEVLFRHIYTLCKKLKTAHVIDTCHIPVRPPVSAASARAHAAAAPHILTDLQFLHYHLQLSGH